MVSAQLLLTVLPWVCLNGFSHYGIINFSLHKRYASKHFMFSGIVEEIGTVSDVVLNKRMINWDGAIVEGVELSILAKTVISDAYIGCSISVNGVCLTATSIDETLSQFRSGLAPETLRKSNLGLLRPGSKVNLERALKVDARNSGHIVQGHVDCTSKILEKWNENDSMWFKIALPPNFAGAIVPKGFISIDGVSLTICEVNTNQPMYFTFMLVPHTQQSVIIPMKSVGDFVNIEVDIVAKLVQQQNLMTLGSNNNVVENSCKQQQEIDILKRKILELEERLTKMEQHLT